MGQHAAKIAADSRLPRRLGAVLCVVLLTGSSVDTAPATGAVDIRGSKVGYALARELADNGRDFKCGKNKPRIAGVETECAGAIVKEHKR